MITHGTFVQKVRLNTGAALDTNDAASELHPPHHAANTRDFRSSSYIKNRNGTSVLEQKERCFFLLPPENEAVRKIDFLPDGLF